MISNNIKVILASSIHNILILPSLKTILLTKTLRGIFVGGRQKNKLLFTGVFSEILTKNLGKLDWAVQSLELSTRVNHTLQPRDRE